LDGNPNFWEKAHTQGLANWLELNLYEHTHDLMVRLIAGSPGNGTALQTLGQTAMLGTSQFSLYIYCMVYVRSLLADGLQAVYDAVIRILECNNSKLEVQYQLLQFTVNILRKCAHEGTYLKLGRSIEILPLLSNLLEQRIENYQNVVRHFVVEFMDCKCKTL